VTQVTVGVSTQPDPMDLPPRLIFVNTRAPAPSPGGSEVPGMTLPPTDAAAGWPAGER
jgi:hypothetical protein